MQMDMAELVEAYLPIYIMLYTLRAVVFHMHILFPTTAQS